VKKIPCEGLDSLKDMEAHGKMLAYVDKYKKRSALGSLLAMLFAPFALGAVAWIYLIALSISLLVGNALRDVFAQSLGELLSSAAADIIVNGIFGVAEAIILAPFLIVALAFVLLFYYSAKSVSSRLPNVAKALYLVDTLKEAEEITLPNKAGVMAYGAFRGIWNKYLRITGSGSVEELSKQVYANGGVISETAVKTMAFTATSSHPSSSGRLRIELEEHGGLVSMVVFLGTEGSTDWLPEVIAIFDKKYTKEIVGKIASCCPSAVIV
jgi:hypothetical protein